MGRTIPPRPLKLKKGTLVCNTHNFDGFTLGKKYKGHINANLFHTTNDMGEKQTPCINGTNLNNSTKIYYFIPLNEWREKRFKKLLD